jgi:hypothetical protein
MNRKLTTIQPLGARAGGSPLAPSSFYLVANPRENKTTKTETKKPFTQLSLQNQPSRSFAKPNRRRRKPNGYFPAPSGYISKPNGYISAPSRYFPAPNGWVCAPFH